jgi:hypothetical protein
MPDQPQKSREDQPLPGSVSNQNGEEAEPGQDEQQETRRPPGSAGGGDDSTSGEAGEGSQSTGNPNSAG